jgi:hypothetical protein
MSTILELTQQQQDIRDRIFFEDDENAIENLNAELETLCTSIEHKLKFLTDLWLELDLDADAKREVARSTQKRAQIAENKAARLRDFIDEMMLQADIKRIDGKYCGFSRTTSEKLVINAPDDQIPAQYHKPPKPPEIDRGAIKAALKDGLEVYGCELVKMPTLRKT